MTDIPGKKLLFSKLSFGTAHTVMGATPIRHIVYHETMLVKRKKTG
jgi:hypothetical protein